MSVMMLILWIFMIPLSMGLPFLYLGKEGKKQIGIALACGYMGMWALFEAVAVPFILASGGFAEVTWTFAGLAILWSLGGIIFFLMRYRKDRKQEGFHPGTPKRGEQSKDEKWNAYISLAAWILFFGILIYQIVMGCIMAFGDGDDAFFIPIAEATKTSGKMYHIVPYTGETSSLDARHGLAPFPVWISFLSKMSGIHSTILAQSILGGGLLVLCYIIFYQIGRSLFEEKKEGLPFFMLFTSLLYLFGNYSLYTPATFLLTRGSQGKAVLANIVLPFLLWCVLELGREYRADRELAVQHKKPDKNSEKRKLIYSVLVVLTTMSAWLCSSLGAFLCGAFLIITGLVFGVVYKSKKALFQTIACLLPSGLYTIIYLMVR